jgi:pyrophosphate--fructose-6-phosphate 1-phosphotransferase
MEVAVPQGNNAALTALLQNDDIRKVISSTSEVMQARRLYKPPICKVFSGDETALVENDQFRFDTDPAAKRELGHIIDNPVQSVVAADGQEAPALFRRKRKIGIVFSGGPAPGGHNVIAGIYDAAKKANPDNRLFGFLVGPDGIIESEYVELTDALVDSYRNLGGFTMIKTGRTKIDTPKKMALAKDTIHSHGPRCARGGGWG